MASVMFALPSLPPSTEGGDELFEALHHLHHHQFTHLVAGDLAVLGHVAAEALQVNRYFSLHLGEELAVGGRLVIGVLTKVDHHWNV